MSGTTVPWIHFPVGERLACGALVRALALISASKSTPRSCRQSVSPPTPASLAHLLVATRALSGIENP